jgi:hypothetical protein
VLPSPLDVVLRFAALIAEPFSGATLLGHALVSLQRWGIGVLRRHRPRPAARHRAGLAAAAARRRHAGVRAAPLHPAVRLGADRRPLVRRVDDDAGGDRLHRRVPGLHHQHSARVSQVDPILVRAARTLGAGAATTLARVVLPVAAPTIFTGLRIAFSNGWMALVGAELVVGKQGLGFLISQGQINDSAATILVGMTTIGVLGTLIDLVLQRVQRIALPWKTAGARPLE